MKEIKTGDNKALAAHIVDCAIKSNVYEGKDANGTFLMVMNSEALAIVSKEKNGKSSVLDKNKGIKVYEKTGKDKAHPIAVGELSKSMSVKKTENHEIAEQMKVPDSREHQNITIAQLINEINNMIRTAESHVQQMDIAVQNKNERAFDAAQKQLKKDVQAIDTKMVELTSRVAQHDPHAAVVAVVAIHNSIEQLQKETERNFTFEKLEEKKKEVRENPYALHLKAMMDIKENLGQEEIRGTIANVQGIVQKEGFGDVTRISMNAANKHVQEAGATAIRDDIDGPTPDTTFERGDGVDIDDLLTNGEQNFSPEFYGVAIAEAGEDKRNREGHGERTRFGDET